MRRIALVALAVASVGTMAAAPAVQARPVGHAHRLPQMHLRFGVRVGRMLRAPGALNTQPLGLSLNWSGWGDTSRLGAFNYVHSKFVQPAIVCNGTKNNFVSEWVGLDGFNSDTVEQTGTVSFCAGKNHRRPVYLAWFEMFPAPSVNVYRIKPGDVIEPTVRFANGTFTLTIADHTNHRTATTSGTCSQCLRSSAEWIIERPALCNNTFTKCFITPLAHFRPTVMAQDWTSIDGGRVSPISRFVHTPLDIVQPLNNNKLKLLDSTSGLFAHGSAFSVHWLNRGAAVPIQL
jgi:hypothetical protein